MKLFLFPLIFTGLFLTSCESEYSRTVKKEMATGVIHDDLIFDLKMGQTQKEFYATCWELNRTQKISQGSGNQYAKFTMSLDSTAVKSEEVIVLFYGIFDEEKIMHGMDMKMSYAAWSPWNEDYHSERLMESLQKKYEKEYPGNVFIPIDLDKDKKAFAKVDGNRRILMYPLSNKDVAVKIEDLREVKTS